MGWMKDEIGLEKTQANFVPLTPFLTYKEQQKYSRLAQQLYK